MSKNRMVVLHYFATLSQNSGGVAAYICTLGKELGRLVDLHILTHKDEDEVAIENSTIHHFTCGRRNILACRREFLQLLEELQPDIFHTNGCWMPLMAILPMIAKRRGVPVVYSPHGMLEPWNIKKNYWTKKLPALLLYQKRSIKQADCLVATCEAERNNLLQLGWNRQIAIVPNGVVVDQIRLKDNWQKRKQILFLALLRRNKGADLIIRASDRLKAELQDYKIIIAGTTGNGEEAYVEELHQLIHNFHLEDIISLPGGVYGEQKWRLYQESDFFILPTLNENFGIVIAESLLSGTPVITCKGAPWSDLVTSNCGWWIERTVEALTEAMRDAIHSSDQFREYMGRNGRRLVESKYASTSVARQMKELYEQICPNKVSEPIVQPR